MQTNRLTVLGGVRPVHTFQRSDWLRAVGGRTHEPLELAPGRYVCQFETTAGLLPALQKISRLHPGLVFLLDYERNRTKGLARVKAGQLTRHEIRY